MKNFVCILSVYSASLSLLLLAGCGKFDEHHRTELAGHVTFDGKPLPFGYINLYPTGGVDIPMSSGKIRDGAFKLAENGGVAYGDYRVEIRGWAAEPVEENRFQAKPPGPANAQLIPEIYNTKTELKLKVDASTGAQQDFHLK
ncbi:hypothetical protein SH661x_003040 [Planctomicrobium sp. SH661]|uniref:hypothetical protein n=1 Tax=Planctomicrobium sp. SH661 TaxID=3448124 RepID=UPI003F5C94D6